MKSKVMTDKDYRQIAMDILEGRIFCNLQVKPEDLARHFMPIMFMNEEQLDEIKGDTGLIYEYIDKAVPMSMNGLPLFMSMRVLSKKAAEKVLKYFEEAKKFKDKFINASEKDDG